MFADAVPLLLFFIFSSLFCLASIVTVIRLVNDAVDNIESEGMKENPVTPPSLCVRAKCLFSGVTLDYNTAKLLPFNPLSI